MRRQAVYSAALCGPANARIRLRNAEGSGILNEMRAFRSSLQDCVAGFPS